VVDSTLSSIFSTGEIAEIYRRYFGEEPSEMTLTLFKLVARN